MDADLLLANGLVVDGTGTPPTPGGVALSGGRIVAIVTPASGEVAIDAARVIDVNGAVIAPGFIDIHSHSDFILPLSDQVELLMPFAEQGITTIVTGNCGYAPAPVLPATAGLLQDYTRFIKPRDLDWEWETFGEFLDVVERTGVFLNTAPLAAHGALRIAAMGFEPRGAYRSELLDMQHRLTECLDAGAFGLSCGLIYAPGMYADTRELIALARLLRPVDAVFTAHVRGSSETLLEASREVVDIGRAAGVRVQHSHLEAFGQRFWPRIESVLELHESAYREIDHGFDVIPYTAANTTFLAILPPWSLAGGVRALLGRLGDPAVRKQIAHEVAHHVPRWPGWMAGAWPHNLVDATGWENVWISWVESERNKHCEGKSVATIASERNVDPFDAAADLIVEEQGCVTALYMGVSGSETEEWALREVIAHPRASIETDAFSLGRGTPHPALVGTFPRVLGRYVRDEGLVTLEEAVRRMTSLSAERLGLTGRGRLEVGYAADITVFDPETVGDRASFNAPRERPSGIDLVIVNGEVVVEGGRGVTSRRAGHVLRRRT